ncbi:MAG: hypothetical protein OXG30_06965 [bacterium]|nr:hypothetical protein [bacterium]
MVDLVVLCEGDEDMRFRYTSAFGRGPHPRDFSRQRMELGKHDFATIKERFLAAVPQLNLGQDTQEAVERVVIWRNMLGHANVQPFRGYLLHTPPPKKWERISRHLRCPQCLKFYADCGCETHDQSEPLTVKIEEEALLTILEDVRTVDAQCLYPAAVSIDVPYRGLAWPISGDEYEINEHRPERRAVLPKTSLRGH